MCRRSKMSPSSSLNPFATPFVSHQQTPIEGQLYLQYPPPPPPHPVVSFRHPPLLGLHYCFPVPLNFRLEGEGEVIDEKVQPKERSHVKRSKYQSRKFRPTTTTTSSSSYRRNPFVPPRKMVVSMDAKKAWVPKMSGNPKVINSPPPVHNFDDIKKTTSVMMRNIPNQFRRDDLLEFLDKCCLGHQLEYDFVYLPIDFRSHKNKGYAFINFTKPKDARMFKQLLDGYNWGRFVVANATFSSNKICEITWAKIQGKDDLVRHFKNSNFPCYCKEYLPVELSPPSSGSADLSTLTTVGRYLGSSSSTNRRRCDEALISLVS